MVDRLEFMYSADAYKARTVTSLPICRLPDAPPPGGRNLTTAREFYGSNIMREIEVNGEDRVAFIEKIFPHSRYDLMMLASDDQIKCAVTDLATGTKEFIFELSAQLVEFISRADVIERYGLQGGHLHMAFNYDRHTTDRENSMCCDKRFHLHLNYWPGDDLDCLQPVQWGEIPSPILRRRLIDPLAFPSELIMRDRSLSSADPLPLMTVDPARDREQGLPIGPKICLPDWQFLRSREFPLLLDKLHTLAASAYSDIREIFTGSSEICPPGTRPKLLPKPDIVRRLDEMQWLSGETRAILTKLAYVLRDVSPGEVDRLCESGADSVRSLTVSGLDYAISLFSQRRNTVSAPLAEGGPVYLTMHCKLFSDVGGAGLPTIDDIPVVRLDRASGRVLAEDEIAARRKLREEFLSAAIPPLVERFGLRDLGLEA